MISLILNSFMFSSASLYTLNNKYFVVYNLHHWNNWYNFLIKSANYEQMITTEVDKGTFNCCSYTGSQWWAQFTNLQFNSILFHNCNNSIQFFHLSQNLNSIQFNSLTRSIQFFNSFEFFHLTTCHWYFSWTTIYIVWNTASIL